MNSCCITNACSFPVGGIIGLVVSLVGYQFFFAEGLSDFESVVEDLGVKNADNITLVATNGVYLIILANLFVCGYGFREKCRTRNDSCHHVTMCGFPSLIKFLVKTAVHLVVCGAVAIALILMLLTEGLYVAFATIDTVCSSDAVDSISEILDLLGETDNSLSDTCDSVGNGLSGTFKVLIGSMILLVSQVIILCYWYKYSTLAMVSPFYTTGKWAKDTTTKNPITKDGKDVEMVNSEPASQASSPGKAPAAEFKPKKAPRKL
jgi:hypothetical protein